MEPIFSGQLCKLIIKKVSNKPGSNKTFRHQELQLHRECNKLHHVFHGNMTQMMYQDILEENFISLSKKLLCTNVIHLWYLYTLPIHLILKHILVSLTVRVYPWQVANLLQGRQSWPSVLWRWEETNIKQQYTCNLKCEVDVCTGGILNNNSVLICNSPY